MEDDDKKNALATGTAANSYKTGVVPKEDFFKFVARCNTNAYVMEDMTTQHPARKLSKEAAAVVKLAELLDDLSTLRDLVSKARVPMLIRGELYGAVQTRFGWSLKALDGTERTLNVDATNCSCEDNRFRNRTCKHMEAIQCFCHRT